MGDRRWASLLADHHRAVVAELDQHRRRLMDTAGDGVFVVVDGPAGPPVALRPSSMRSVHIGARVAALAGPGEVLVSGTVHDLVVGSGIAFADRGTRELAGVPGPWRIYAPI